MIYKYKGIDKNGKKVKGEISATSLKEAKQKLNSIIILEIKEKKNITFYKKISNLELANFLNIFALYLKSSIPILKAISLTKEQTENSKLKTMLDAVEKEIKEGKNLYNAFLSQKVIKIPNFILQSIKIGQESGKIDIVLLEVSKFLKEEEKIKNRVSQAMIYPMFIIFTAIFIVSFMLTTIVPKMVNIFKTLHQDLPLTTKIVIESGNFLQNNYLSIITIFIIFTSLFLFIYHKFKKIKLFFHKIFIKIPFFKKIIISKELGRFTYLTYILTNSGINYIKSIELAASTIENEYIKLLFNKALKYVKEGKKFSSSLLKVNFIDKNFIQAVALIEETGESSNILQNISEIYIQENENRINTLLNMLEPTLIIIIGAIIGFIVSAMLVPLLNMNIIQ